MKQHSSQNPNQNPNQKPRPPRGRMPGGQQRGKGGGGGGGGNGSSRNQTFDSNGPSIRIRGSAHQVMEKYLALARDAASQGDRVLAENYLQHAEHYFRIIQNSQPRQPRVNSPAAADGAEGPQPDQDSNGNSSDDDSDNDNENDEAQVEVIRPAAHANAQENQDADDTESVTA
jgi:hypothetical protein